MGGLPGWVPPDLAAVVSAGGLPSLPPACPAVCLLFCPLSPSPLPRRGRGRLKVYFAGGFAPGTPALNRLRHLQTPPEQVHGGTTRREPIPVGFAANHGFSRLGDARGEAPCIRKLKISPFPPGRGSGGWGATKQAKGGVGRANQHRPKERTPCQNRRESPIQYSVTLIRQSFPLRPCGIRSACRLPHGRCVPGKHQSRASRIRQAAGSRQCRKPAPRWD